MTLREDVERKMRETNHLNAPETAGAMWIGRAVSVAVEAIEEARACRDCGCECHKEDA